MSALCLIACVLLIVLWMRSYTHIDSIAGTISNSRQLELQSMKGRCFVLLVDSSQRPIGSFARYSVLDLENLKYLTFNYAVLGSKIDRLWVAHWILILISASVAALPWIRWRFSLRALLIATTLVAVVLGVAVYLANRPPTTPPLDHGDWPNNSVSR